MITESARRAGEFYVSRIGPGAIGFDGMGAIDFTKSDLKKMIVASGPRIAERQEAYIANTGNDCRIFMRRAVREFDLCHDYRLNSLIVSSQVLSDYAGWIQPSARSLTAVSCHFGAKERPYYFGNLKHSDVLDQCIWQKSRFSTVDTSDFDINQTRIARGEVPLEHEVRYSAVNQEFAGESEYLARKPSLHIHVPERLAFSFAYCDILNIGIGMTLISARLFEALWNRKRPKSRVLGMTGSRPLVHVEFEVDATCRNL